MKNTRYINNVSEILDINMLLNKNYEYNFKINYLITSYILDKL